MSPAERRKERRLDVDLSATLFDGESAVPCRLRNMCGKGFLIGIKLIPNNREFMVLARDEKLLIAGGGDNCVRLLPPLNLTVEEASEAIAKLEKACEAARAKAAA